MGLKSDLFNAGHSACAGCGMAIAIRHIMEIMGPDTIVANATGCSEIVSSNYPRTAFGTPYIHCLFENPAAIATGIVHALRSKGNDHTKVIVIAGDGSTYDIGFGILSGMLERNEDVLYICYDNEAYMNTGYQRSGATPHFAKTTTSPVGSQIHGKQQDKKPIADIVAAHKIPYVATASIAYLNDFLAKLKKAKDIKGSRFIVVHTQCVPGWGIDPAKGIKICKAAVDSGVWPLYEIENGVKKFTYKPAQFIPVKDYFTGQVRYKHLTEEEVAKADEWVKKQWK